MALVECIECGKSISSQAASCPHCGIAVAAPKSTPTKPGKRTGPPSPGAIICAALAFIGIVFLFIAWPIGLSMFFGACFISFFTKDNKIPVLIGNCPHCSALINLPASSPGAPCPVCRTPFLSVDGRFREVPRT